MQQRRPVVRGKFVWSGGRKLYVRGITYGTFRPGEDGSEFRPDVVESDFAAIADAGFNTVRTYTVPPRWLLDAAERHGLLVFVGMPWEQHIAFLDDRARCDAIEHRVREGVRACAGHPAVLAYSIGNEIPASIVRWHGRRRVEAFLERLFRAAKDEDPEGLVTYVNFPTTEYLELPFLDLCAFNVYLEDEERLSAYIARLQVVADDRPLLMAEIGLDSRSNGEDAQAEALRWQLRTAFRSGCAGAMVFAWTDEWHRGGFDIEDWDFGLVRRDRSPKPALDAVRTAVEELPLAPPGGWPRFSVVVCSYNGAATLRECLSAAVALDYPDFEVLVVDDGSTDATSAIAESFGVRLVRTPNRGLSAARNTGAEAATGELVAYLDDDAAPDPHWLTYLATTYATTEHVAVGGPNLPPPGDGVVADCVANAPGNATHVLLSDDVAEHIPGCNCSFRRDALLEVGGFDEQFRIAGDDVDLCWRLQERGWTIGFNAAAMVWHHRRRTVGAFLRQQRNYGRAEAMLERKWPDKYNGVGHVSWAGRVYAPGRRALLERWRVYYGTWGTGFFQRLYATGQPRVAHGPLMPEWLLVVAALLVVTGLGGLWAPLLAAAPLLALATGAVVADAWRGAGRARYATPPATRRGRLGRRVLTAGLFALQAAARLQGRLLEGLRPWGRRARLAAHLPRPRVEVVWSESWRAVEDRLHELEARLRDAGLRVRRGGDFDRWDLEVRGGVLASSRVRTAVEEHGGGRQLIRFGLVPRVSAAGAATTLPCAALAVAALADGALVVAGVLGTAALALAACAAVEAGSAMAATRDAVAPQPAWEPVAAEAAAAPVAAVPEPVGAERHTVVAGPIDGQSLRELLLALDDDGGPGTDLGSDTDRGGATRICVLPAEPVILPLSVAENIAFGRPRATPEEVRAAARAAGADAFIDALPEGFETLVGDTGERLSSEERHRVAIARAFLQDAPVLVLGAPLDGFGNGAGARLREPLERLVRTRRTFVLSDDAVTGGSGRVPEVDGDEVVEVA